VQHSGRKREDPASPSSVQYAQYNTEKPDADYLSKIKPRESEESKQAYSSN